MAEKKLARLDCLMRITYDVDESAIVPEMRVPHQAEADAPAEEDAAEPATLCSLPSVKDRPERVKIPA
jgi:hypothetical protein